MLFFVHGRICSSSFFSIFSLFFLFLLSSFSSFFVFFFCLSFRRDLHNVSFSLWPLFAPRRMTYFFNALDKIERLFCFDFSPLAVGCSRGDGIMFCFCLWRRVRNFPRVLQLSCSDTMQCQPPNQPAIFASIAVAPGTTACKR